MSVGHWLTEQEINDLSILVHFEKTQDKLGKILKFTIQVDDALFPKNTKVYSIHIFPERDSNAELLSTGDNAIWKEDKSNRVKRNQLAEKLIKGVRTKYPCEAYFIKSDMTNLNKPIVQRIMESIDSKTKIIDVIPEE